MTNKEFKTIKDRAILLREVYQRFAETNDKREEIELSFEMEQLEVGLDEDILSLCNYIDKLKAQVKKLKKLNEEYAAH